MTVATLRSDGWPQASTVGNVNEGLTLYLLCSPDSQKARNLARDNRVSLTIDHDTPDLMAIRGLSMAGCAHQVEERDEAARVLRMLPQKYPESHTPPIEMPGPSNVRIFRITPIVISVLDYSRGFDHTDFVECRSRSAPGRRWYAAIARQESECTEPPGMLRCLALREAHRHDFIQIPITGTAANCSG